MKKELFDQMLSEYMSLETKAFTLTHYQLAVETSISDPQLWKEFLMTPQVMDFKASEMAIIRETAMNQITQDAGDSNSVGKAQLLNTLGKLSESGAKKEGPAFIYCYVEGTPQQQKAPNYRTINLGNVRMDEKGVLIIDE